MKSVISAPLLLTVQPKFAFIIKMSDLSTTLRATGLRGSQPRLDDRNKK